MTACAAAVNGCWHWLWQKLSCAGVATVTWMTPLVSCRGDHLVEPDAVEARVLRPDDLEDLLPERRVEQRRLRARGERLASRGDRRCGSLVMAILRSYDECD